MRLHLVRDEPGTGNSLRHECSQLLTWTFSTNQTYRMKAVYALGERGFEMTDVYIRCAGLLVEDDSLLLMRYDDPEIGDIWQYPGGGLEANETIAEGVGRELREETGHAFVFFFWVTRKAGQLGVDAEDEPSQTEMRFAHRDEELTASILNPELWDRLWSDWDEGATGTIYLGAKRPYPG